MKILKTKIKGVHIIKISAKKDSRGSFTRLFCEKILKKKKIKIKQINNSINKKIGTTRGLHYQIKPFEEDKIIKCIKGSLVNIIVDMRKKSKTYLKHILIKLDEKKSTMSLVPKGCANGIQTLQKNTEIVYFVSNFYSPLHERGLNYKDPSLQIKLPKKINVMSKKDKKWPYIKI